MKFGKKKRTGKKAFIASALVDFWAYIMLVVIIIVFAIIYKITAEVKLNSLESVRDISYGNYLAHVYLRSPITIADKEMPMAELIALYDYNQTLEKQQGRSFDELDIISRPEEYLAAVENPMREAILEITERFVSENFPEGGDYIFIMITQSNG